VLALIQTIASAKGPSRTLSSAMRVYIAQYLHDQPLPAKPGPRNVAQFALERAARLEQLLEVPHRVYHVSDIIGFWNEQAPWRKLVALGCTVARHDNDIYIGP
jgi:hypothetical protein